MTGIACLQIYTLIQTNDIKLFKNSSLNLAVSDFDLSTPEEKRYITDIPKTERSAAIKVIPEKYNVWEKMDFYGPNLKVKNLVIFFKTKYNVDINYINYKNTTLDSPNEDDEEDLEKSIEELIKEYTNFHINEKTKYIQLEITGCIENDDFDICTPTIRYNLK